MIAAQPLSKLGKRYKIRNRCIALNGALPLVGGRARILHDEWETRSTNPRQGQGGLLFPTLRTGPLSQVPPGTHAPSFVYRLRRAYLCVRARAPLDSAVQILNSGCRLLGSQNGISSGSASKSGSLGVCRCGGGGAVRL
jgi:hypothetical protein